VPLSEAPPANRELSPGDPTQDVPGDCSNVFNLLSADSSYLASTQCLPKVTGARQHHPRNQKDVVLPEPRTPWM
jgi:hypothetical protein